MVNFNGYPVYENYLSDNVRAIVNSSYMMNAYNSGDRDKVNVVIRAYDEEIRYEDYKFNDSVVNINMFTTFVGKNGDKTSQIKEKKEVMFDRNQSDFSSIAGKMALFFKPTGHGMVVNVNQISVAEYYSDLKTINILLDREFFEREYTTRSNVGTKILNDHGKRLLQIIFEKVAAKLKERLLIDELKSRVSTKSWITKSDELRETLKKDLEKEISDKIDATKEKLQKIDQNIADTKSKFVLMLKDKDSSMKMIKLLNEDKTAYKGKTETELDLIAAYPLIDDLTIEGSVLQLITKYIPIRVGDKTYTGNAYYISIDINTVNLIIKSAIGLGYKGFWTKNDPHPHVSNNGSQCLGNLATTLAELCQQREIYALVIMIIEFLKTANIDDSAGSTVTRYPLLDDAKLKEIYASYESGNIDSIYELSEQEEYDEDDRDEVEPYDDEEYDYDDVEEEDDF